MADVASKLDSWSTTSGSNSPTGTTIVGAGLDDNLRQIQAVVRELAASNTLASATTTDLSTIDETFITVSGTTTITGLGTLTAGMYKWLTFSGILTLTYNAASLITPTTGNITTAVNDCCLVKSLGSGNWQVMIYQPSSGQPVSGSTAPRSYLAGCTLSTAGSSATMSIAAGQATDSTNVSNLVLAAIAKTTSSWAVGTGNGGLDTGAIAASTWYKFYVIKRVDTGVTDVIFTIAALGTGPQMPANYTLFRYIGSGKTNGSSQWTSFIQDGDYFRWLAGPALDVTTTNPGTSAVTATLTVPTGINVLARFNWWLAAGSGISACLFSDLAQTDEAPSTTATPLGNWGGNQSVNYTGQFEVRTNTTAQIRYRCAISDAAFVLKIVATGWADFRGRNG